MMAAQEQTDPQIRIRQSKLNSIEPKQRDYPTSPYTIKNDERLDGRLVRHTCQILPLPGHLVQQGMYDICNQLVVEGEGKPRKKESTNYRLQTQTQTAGIRLIYSCATAATATACRPACLPAVSKSCKKSQHRTQEQ